MPTLTLRNLGYPSNSPAGAIALNGVEVRAGVGPGPQGPSGATGPAGAGGGTLAGDVTGAAATNTVARIRGQPVAATAPTSGQVLRWSGTQWAPVDPPTGPPVVNVPTVTGVAPNTGPQAGGTSVIIAGTNFTGATAVRFGVTAAASFTVNSATQITATSPAGSGAVNVTVTTADGTSAAAAANLFTYAAALTPTVTSLNPTSGAETGGTTVVITGTNLTGATAVHFGAVAAASFTVNSATQITATSPAGTGNVAVIVTTPNGTSPASSQFMYSVPAGDYALAVAHFDDPAPPSPVNGTLWYDGSADLRVYVNGVWRGYRAGGASVTSTSVPGAICVAHYQNTPPTGPHAAGTLWFNSSTGVFRCWIGPWLPQWLPDV